MIGAALFVLERRAAPILLSSSLREHEISLLNEIVIDWRKFLFF
jgi:hypothetical protein